MEIFDGFISAIASEFKIPFRKDSHGNYTTTIEFENGRSQDILVYLKKDESGDRVIHYHAVVVSPLKQGSKDIYKTVLKKNLTLDYGALALDKEALVMRNTILLEDCDPRRFMKSLVYIAAKADELEEQIQKGDIA
jgi:hypothetical protein